MTKNYYAGALAALTKLGFDADSFAQFAEEDQTEAHADTNVPAANMPKNVDKAPAWSGQNSLESGDVGTRNYQMGLPRAGGV